MGYTWPTVNLKPNESPAVTWFNKQTLRKNNVINGLITGQVGQGKSYLGLSLLYQKNPDFNLNEQMFFSATKLMKSINKDGFFDRRGTEIFYDESAVDLANTNWQQLICKSIFSFFLTHRSRNYVFLMCSPQQSYLTKPIRTLLNFKIKSLGWDEKNNSLGVPFYQEWNEQMDKPYTKRLIIRQKGQPSQFCNQIRVPLPPKPFMKEYERLKSEFQRAHAEDLCSQLEEMENKSSGKNPVQTKVQYEVLEWIRQGKTLKEIVGLRFPGTKPDDKDYRIKAPLIHATITQLRKQGITIVTDRGQNHGEGGNTKWILYE